jgi:hypothetical protein
MHLRPEGFRRIIIMMITIIRGSFEGEKKIVENE